MQGVSRKLQQHLQHSLAGYRHGGLRPDVVAQPGAAQHGCSGSFFLVLILAGLLALPGRSSAQPVGVSADLSEAAAPPNGEFTLTLSIDEPADLYYFGAIVRIDAQQVEYVTLTNVGITEGGAKIDGAFDEGNQIGLAVSRTDGAAISQSGPFMELTFRIQPTADTGSYEIEFQDPQMNDSQNNPIPFDPPAPVLFEVLEGVGRAELTGPATPVVTEGDPLEMTARVYAAGVSGDPLQSGRLTTWIGVSPENSDPAGWEESLWLEAEPDDEPEGESDGYAHFTRNVAELREPGSWYVALRTRIDDGPIFYGGTDGFWDGVESPSALLTVEPMPVFRYTLARWDFEQAGLQPFHSIPANDTSMIRLHNAGPPDDPIDTHTASGVTYLNTRGWHPPAAGEQWIGLSISTRHFEGLEISSRHAGSGSGPARFHLQTSTDGDQWEDLPGGEIDLSSQSDVHLQNLPLPEPLEDRDRIYLRWLKTGGERIDGNNAPVSGVGIHRIGGIAVTGLNRDPRRVEVMPGDADRNGTVNAQDVLMLAHYWLSRGPLPAYDFIDFKGRQVEEWIPGPATHADTNGDGVVDHRDLMAIGLHFGKSVSPAPQQLLPEPLAVLPLPETRPGEEALFTLRTDRRHYLKGVAVRFRIEGLPEEAWSVQEELPDWAEAWDNQERLLTFLKRSGNAFEQAWSLQGRRDSVESALPVTVRLRALQEWPPGGRIVAEWTAVSGGSGLVEELEAAEMQAGIPEEPPYVISRDGVSLYQNYPNPFRPQTVIRYHLPRPEHVRLEVYNMAGRRVAVLVDREQSAGYHTIRFNASHLAGGVYFYRLRTEGSNLARKMVRIR